MMRLLRNWPHAVSAAWTGKDLQVVIFRNGVRLQAPPSLNLAFIFYEIWVQEIYALPGYAIGDGAVVIDVGANIGTFALFAATAAQDVSVYAYEPFPENVDWLRSNITASGVQNVQACSLAVAGQSGQRTLCVDSDWIMHRLGESDGTSGSMSVDCISLDDVFTVHKIDSCNLLKLDCEGSELEILRDCSDETICRVNRIVGEQHYESGSLEEQQFRAVLEERGFQIDRFETPAAGGAFAARRVSVVSDGT